MPDPALDSTPQASPSSYAPAPSSTDSAAGASGAITAALSHGETFLKFNYPELKDLGKHFLTVASATAVFVLTFIEKIVGTTPLELIKHLMAVTVAVLLVAIACAGAGLFTNYIAGSGASGAIIWGIGKERFRGITIFIYVPYIFAGVALFSAYVLLAYVAMCR